MSSLLISELSEVLQTRTGDDGRSSYTEELFNELTDAFLIVKENNQPIACGGFRKVDRETCEIKRMYSKKKGYGKKVLSALEKRATELHYKTAILSTRKINTSAVNFYLARGFKEIPPYGKYRKTHLSICMGKRING